LGSFPSGDLCTMIQNRRLLLDVTLREKRVLL
jgi:hypothetical protein